VAGVGTSDFAPRSDAAPIELLAQALTAALDDAGLTKDEIDGLVVNAGIEVDRAAVDLGLDVHFGNQTWAHGRLSAATLHDAAMAVHVGLADVVLCTRVVSHARLRNRVQGAGNEAFRAGGGAHWEYPYLGINYGGEIAAMAFNRYLATFGGDADQLGAFTVAIAKHAELNPNAHHRGPTTMDEYLRSPYLVEPLRLADATQLVDGAICMLVTSTERARDLRGDVVTIAGIQGMRAGREQATFCLPGMGIAAQSEFRYERDPSMRLWDMAGLGPDDVDLFYAADSFTPNVLTTMELYGLCPPGEGLAWAQGGRVEIGGELPVNTNGGSLFEGSTGGWGHMVEAVRQLRGEAGPRQVEGARVAVYANSYSSVLFAAPT
jgi:acetyl-CoA acetyltransferase